MMLLAFDRTRAGLNGLQLTMKAACSDSAPRAEAALFGS